MIVTITGVYAVSAWLQWDALREANDLTQKSIETDARAWMIGVSVTGFSIVPGQEKTLTMASTNVGKGPAMDVEQMLVWELREERLPGNAPRQLPKSQYSRGVVGPGNGFTTTFTMPAFTPEQVAKVKSRDSFIYVRGWTDYRDQFRTEHHLVFCWFYEPDRGEFVLCENNNHID